jgi:hypothetical protein
VDAIWGYLAERNLKPQQYLWRADRAAIPKKYAELWKLWLEADKLIETIPRHGTSAGSSPACGTNAGIPSSRSDQIRGFRERENMGQSSLFWSPWFFRRFATFLLRGFYVNVCIPTLNQQKSAYISA